MKLVILAGLLILVTTVYSDVACPQPENQPENYQITYVSGKCWYLLKTTGSYSSNSNLCKRSNGLSLAKIESQAENEFAQGVLSLWGMNVAFIGYNCPADKEWIWDGDVEPNTGYSNLVTGTPGPPVNPGPTVITTKRTTLGLGNRRRPTSVVLLLDSSVYSTPVNSKSQLSFYQQLGQYISDRGDAEFAIYLYGCDTSTPTDYVDDYTGLLGLLNSTISTTVNQSTRVKPFAPNGILDVVDTFVSYYYAANAQYKKKYSYLSVLFFSTVNDDSLINAAPAMISLTNEQVITVAVGKNAASLSKFSIPAADTIRINDFSDMNGLIQKVDKMMFPISGASSFLQEPPRSGAIDLSQYDATRQNAILNATDGFWYPMPTSTKAAMLCTGPPLTPNPNPTAEDPAKCDGDNLVYYQDLQGDFCFGTSLNSLNFSTAQSDCSVNQLTLKHPPQLVTVENIQMQQKLSSLASAVPDQGMFWIGLMYNSTVKQWIWQDGTVVTNSSFTNWRPGYPRLADDSTNCVAYVINDDNWINTNCEKQLTAICAIKNGIQN